jgi:hypothetical protein
MSRAMYRTSFPSKEMDNMDTTECIIYQSWQGCLLHIFEYWTPKCK